MELTKEQWDLKAHLDRMKSDPEFRDQYLRKLQTHKTDEFFDYLNRIEKFREAMDVPNLPKFDKEEWENKVVPLLIEKGALPKNQLEHGKWYYGEYRNSQYGRWNAKEELFDHLRYKFGYKWDTCKHFEDDNGFALFVPLREATQEEVNKMEELDELSRERIGFNGLKAKV